MHINIYKCDDHLYYTNTSRRCEANKHARIHWCAVCRAYVCAVLLLRLRFVRVNGARCVKLKRDIFKILHVPMRVSAVSITELRAHTRTHTFTYVRSGPMLCVLCQTRTKRLAFALRISIHTCKNDSWTWYRVQRKQQQRPRQNKNDYFMWKGETKCLTHSNWFTGKKKHKK